SLLLSLVDAETGQRGYLLSGRPEFLEPYSKSEISVRQEMQELERFAAGDGELEAPVAQMLDAARDKLAELERSIALSRTGRADEALDLVRSGQGRALMESIRTRMAAIDEIENARLEARTSQSELGSRLTLAANALGGLLVLALA